MSKIKTNFKYKVCILAAGMGKRMSPLTLNINKALLPINFKAAISHIIEKFDKSIEIVIAVGYQKIKLKEYLQCAHSDRKITLVDVLNYSGSGSGPGFSLLRCKSKLNSPFIFFSVDTMVTNKIPIPDENWMGVSKVSNPINYCTVSIKQKLISRLDDKTKTNNKFAFIGLAGIKDYKLFFDTLKSDSSLVGSELQVSNGFKGLIYKDLKSVLFDWFDIGSIEGYINYKSIYSHKKDKFNFEKSNEYLYFVNNKVIKYFEDKEIVKQRVIRSKILKKITPKIDIAKNFFYSYKKVPGRTIYELNNIKIINKLFETLKNDLWHIKKLSPIQSNKFKLACKKFYYDKTFNRLSEYYAQTKVVDKPNFINGKKVNSLKNILLGLNWNWIFNGTPSKFHGDLQFENILLSNTNKFVFLDWRQDFGGNLKYGDLYYDLAKLNGGMYVSYPEIKKGLFEFSQFQSNIKISNKRNNFLINCKKKFDKFIKVNGYDLKKIETITGLIFLNMAAMHHEPFNHFIYNLGRQKLEMVQKNIL